MITIFTAYSPHPDWNPLADLVVPILQEYSDRHGYELVVSKGGHSLHPDWAFPMQKTALFRDLLVSSKSEFLWCLDIDTMITNLTIPVSQFVDGRFLSRKKDIYMCNDLNGLNGGSYLVRNTNFSESWLSSILSLETVATSENHAMWLLNERKAFRDATQVLPHPTINSIPYHLYPSLGRKQASEGQWEPGHLLAHLPGMTPQDRFKTFSSSEFQDSIVR